ncbi:MAG: hypothetical protein K5873_09585 [Treponema sp.]|nr:hypothetical protein [Treponema sp.]
MKKIVSAALVASLVAGAAFAEVTVNQNFRFRPNLLKVESIDEKSGKSAYTKTTFADLDAYGACSDSLSIAGKTDFAGLKADLTLTSGITKNGNASNALSTTDLKTYTGTTDGTSNLMIDNFYGWLNWGAFKLSGGVFDSRYTNRGNYTATEEGILDKEFSKALGLSGSVYIGGSKNDTTYGLKDFGNVAQVDGGNYLSLLADYTFDDIGGGKLLIKGGLVENAGDAADSKGAIKNSAISSNPYDVATNDDANTTYQQSAGYVAEAAWSRDDLMKVDVIFKNPVNKEYGFGIYITPLMIPNTKNVVLGFTYGTVKDTASAFAIDARAQYNINDAATVALGAKFESITPDGKDAETALQVAGEASYKINDYVTAALDLGYFNYDLDDNDGADDGSQQFVVSGRAKISAGKNAAITTALRYTATLNYLKENAKTKGTFDIPVVMRIKM